VLRAHARTHARTHAQRAARFALAAPSSSTHAALPKHYTHTDRSYEDLFKEEIARRGLSGGSVTSSREDGAYAA
jgi:hypothetical protein